MIRLLIADDETSIRECLVDTLAAQQGITVVGEAHNGREAIEQACTLGPDVILMDVQMPIMSGLEATRIIVAQYPKIRVVILSTYDHDEYVLEGIRAGAMAYALKDSHPQDIVNTVRRVHGGERFIQPAIANRILFGIAGSLSQSASSLDQEPLTERETAVLMRLAEGMSNRAVAADLGLTEGTVRNYVSSILSKLQVTNRVQAINLARQNRLI